MDKDLHDQARERADTALRECRELLKEGVPRRAARIRVEMLQLLQAMWLVSDIQTRFVKEGERDTKTLNFAADMMAASSAAEVSLINAIRSLEALANSVTGEDLGSCYESAMKNLSDEWLLGYFTLVYQDMNRDKKIAALNRALDKEARDRG